LGTYDGKLDGMSFGTSPEDGISLGMDDVVNAVVVCAEVVGADVLGAEVQFPSLKEALGML